MKMKLLIAMLFISFASFAQKKISVDELKSDYKINPLGIGNLTPSLSWKLISSERNTMQSAYELRVSDDKETTKTQNQVWNTGKVVSDQSIHIIYSGNKLKSNTRYFWQVRVWDNYGNVSPWSAVNFWETGLLNPTDWKAKWIQTAMETDGKTTPAPMFGKNFQLKKTVKSARLYITSHGIYEAELNGKRVGDDYFTPGWTAYKKRLQYQTYDITSLLKQGENTVLVTVGDGWFRGYLEYSNKRNLYGKEVALLAQFEIEYTDGSKETIATNSDWKSSFSGPIIQSDIYNGETYDARLAKNTESVNGSDWQNVRVMDFKDNLVAQYGPPVVKNERLSTVKFIKTPKGELVADFGQNMVGWVQLKIKGNAGDTITIDHAEVLDKNGNFYTENLRRAKQENKYILSGKEEILEPHFTFQGFRYAKITGFKGTPSNDMLTGIVIHSDMKQTALFTTSNKLVNQLQQNIIWGQKGNFLDVPTDCPQRDERLGWTGDAQVFFKTAAFNMDVAGFFTKWLADLKAEQQASGNVPAVIPNAMERKTSGSSGWGDVATIIPWQFYQIYGDKELLAGQYTSMKKWVDFIKGVSKNNLWNSGHQYGDWLFYTMDNDRDGKAAVTDKFLIAQTFFAASTQNVINAAKILNRTDDIIKYSALLKDIKDAFMREYVTPDGRLVSSTQTAYVLALNFDMLPENMRKRAAERLVENIASYKNHLTTGFLGTPYLCNVLSRFGHTDIAYKLLLQETYPSWLYPVKQGATTIWERWNGIKPNGDFEASSMNSFNHYAYGAIGDWMYRTITGINNNPNSAGYKDIIIAPQLGGDFKSASAIVETPYGEVESLWQIDGEKINFTVVIPPNTRAEVTLPNSVGAVITESKMELSKSINFKNLSKSNVDVKLALGSGRYIFEYIMMK